VSRWGFRAPAEVRARVPGERVLAWLPSGSSTVVATPTALVLAEGSTPERLPWDLVLRASWLDESCEVTAQLTPGSRPVVFHVPVTGNAEVFAGVVRERVNASIVVQHHVPLTDAGGVRIIVRRVPESTDLRWSVVFDRGMDPADPVLRQLADDAVADLRGSLGV